MWGFTKICPDFFWIFFLQSTNFLGNDQWDSGQIKLKNKCTKQCKCPTKPEHCKQCCTEGKHCMTDWLMIAYIALFSILLSRLNALACGSTWVTSFIAHFVVEYPPKWCTYTYSTGMAGATWNCSRHGTSPVYTIIVTIQPCTMSLHAKPHT